MPRARLRALPGALSFLLVVAATAQAQTPHITTPMEQFGHNIGDDYWLATYTQLVGYWQKLAKESDRMVLDTIGTTAEGRPQLMAIITSPENHRNLARYKEISARLAKADGLSDDEAKRLAAEGKAVVWIDGGLHATEVLGAAQLMETVYQLVSRTDPETMRFLQDDIVLGVHANPDGMELVSSWYMRNPNPEQRSTGGIPRLYQKYVGHDNNRDFYASTQPETENMNRVMYTEWFPQIVYNHHQTGPAGTVMFSPPFRDPFNFVFDPLIVMDIDLVGAAMHDRFLVEDKPGVTFRSGSSYSTWWNGGLRTAAYFHNMVGLLTETIGNPTPVQIPFIPSKQLPSGDLPAPIEPQTWHFRQSVDYSITANRAVLDIASRRRDLWLYGIYKMGANSIERGNEDHWTNYPRRVEAAAAQLAAGRGNANGGDPSDENQFAGRGGASGTRAQFEKMLRDPALRDPRGYIIPSNQADFLTATKFINALLENGITVMRATRDFQVAGKSYPAGSFVVKGAQAFRPHVIDMFEPQDHPDDIPYPGANPTPPYDNAGWTLAFQMGVKFDRILDGFDGPFEKVEGWNAKPPAGGIIGTGTAGYMLSHEVNDAFVAVNRLIAARRDVQWIESAETVDGRTWPAGTFYIPAGGPVRGILQKLVTDKGLTFTAVSAKPKAPTKKLEPVRLALVDRYGGSQPAGWTRWIFEQFEFPFDVVFASQLDAGKLNSKYDVIVFVDGAIPESDRGGRGGRGGGGGGGGNQNIPAEFQNQLTNVSVATTVPQLKSFLEAGGTVITIGSSTALANHLGLPVSDALVERAGSEERHLPRSKFYVPGSLLSAKVDATMPIAAGIGDRVDVFFDNSPVFRIDAQAAGGTIKPIAWYDSKTPLRSGWAWGQNYLEGGLAALQANVGKGKLYMFGPEIAFRAQPHGTFKFLFNGIYYGPVAK